MSDQRGAESRHLGIVGIRRYLEAVVPGRLQVEGDPPAYLVVDPAAGQLAVQVPATGPLPNITQYENVKAIRVRQGGSAWNQLGVVAGDRLEDLYPLLCQVLDRVQMEGQSFANAVLDVLAIYHAVLTRRSALSEAEQIGLFGELLVLRHLAETIGTDSAMASWLGPSKEEHDFALHAANLEVKTTSGERRRHWISSLTQLAPTVGKDLFLVSIQVSAAGDDGLSLPMLVEDLQHVMIDPAHDLSDQLEIYGYRTTDADLYSKRWTLRTPPALFLVDEQFPALRRGAMGELTPLPDRIVDLRYQIDLGGLPRTQVTALIGFVDAEGDDHS